MKITFVDQDGKQSSVTQAVMPGENAAADSGQPRMPGTDRRHKPTPEGDALDPTRYLDWEKNGQCIDF
jgi:hypothetical protein